MATYQDAAKFFEQNVSLLSPEKDKALWNLNSGLLTLCKALNDQSAPTFCEADSLSSRLDSVEGLLHQLLQDSRAR